MEDFLRKKKK